MNNKEIKVEILSPYLVRYPAEYGYFANCYGHYCPACNEMHPFAVERPFNNGARWEFNRNFNKPTFTPSMNIVRHCHYFLTDGKIIYCEDSPHRMRGQTIDLPPIPQEIIDNF